MTQTVSTNAIYQAVWRWHFYAGLVVLPVLMLMALTGGIYLFRGEIGDLTHRTIIFVEQRASTTSPDAWAAAALKAVPGRIAQVSVPADPDRSARLLIETPGGERRSVYVDPHDARVLGDLPEAGAMDLVKRLHSLDIAGPVANLFVEVVAGWAIVMVATGIFLWWPRGQSGGVVTVRGSPKRRLFWRDAHAVTGAFTGLIIVFLAATGMPWSAVWGAQVRKMTTEAGWGRPAAPGGAASHGHEDHAGHDAPAVPWALQATTIPAKDAAPLPLGVVIAHAEDLGLRRPFTLTIPAESGRAWSASHTSDKVEGMRTLFLDGATGQALADIGYDRFGPAAKTIEWGIAVHQGQQFGLINKLIMLAGCIGIWLLGLSSFVMWWKRKPKGRLAAPPPPTDKKAYWGLALIVLPLGILYPLVGASLVLVLSLDLLVRKALPPRRAASEGSR
jgi:uncharacterized iron-regulated membrane protein